MSMDAQFIKRECKITRTGETAAEQTLTVAFLKPKATRNREYVATARVSCDYFDERVTARGLDEVQALAGLLIAVRGALVGKTRQGYDIWWLAAGDLAWHDFWSYTK